MSKGKACLLIGEKMYKKRSKGLLNWHSIGTVPALNIHIYIVAPCRDPEKSFVTTHLAPPK